MDMTTKYLGLELKHPFMPGACPLADNLDTVKKLEDAGASAIVVRSLFEEQIVSEEMATLDAMDAPAESFAEALSYFPKMDSFKLGPEDYLEHLKKVKDSVAIPIIASLNGTTDGSWLRYANKIEEAGADALELNVYMLATDASLSCASIEDRTVEMVKKVKSQSKIPVAVKLSPYYSSLAHFAKRLEEAGADGLVLFNRFYQPDIDVDELEAKRELVLSDSNELLLRLRWLSILGAGPFGDSLAASGGVLKTLDAIKAVMCGAHCVQLVSALLKRGPQYIKTIIEETTAWLERHEYESINQMQGSMTLDKVPNPGAFERANYVEILKSW